MLFCSLVDDAAVVAVVVLLSCVASLVVEGKDVEGMEGDVEADAESPELGGMPRTKV